MVPRIISCFTLTCLLLFVNGQEQRNPCSDLNYCVPRGQCNNQTTPKFTLWTPRRLQESTKYCAIGQDCCHPLIGARRETESDEETIFEECDGNESCVDYKDCLDEISSSNQIINKRTKTEARMKKHGKFSPRFNKIACGQGKVCCTRPADYIQCGIQNVRTEPIFDVRILSDQTAMYGEFPWMILILNKTVKRGKEVLQRFAGGSLIRANVVLTAAHSVQEKSHLELVARAGEWNLEDSEEMMTVDQNIKEIIIHEDYDEDNYLATDIALLILEKPFEISETINVICLPPQGKLFNLKRCTAIGWGKSTFEQETNHVNILKKVELPIVPRMKCQSQLKATGALDDTFTLHRSFLCAGGVFGEDSCNGDGGSPLFCPVEGDTANQYYQVGIVSWGIGCGDENVPGVYANVAEFKDWIDSKVSPGQKEYDQVEV